MATPMQYELIGKILSVYESGKTFREHADMPQKAADTTLGTFGLGIKHGELPLIDASEIVAMWLKGRLMPRPELPINADGTVDAKTSDAGVSAPMEHNPVFLHDAMKPHTGRNIYDIECPWPAALFVAHLYETDGLTAWLVVTQGASWGVWPFVIGHQSKYGLWMGSIADRLVSIHGPDDRPVNSYHLATALTLSFASAQNASWLESTPNRATRRRHPAIAGIRFRHIEIDMGKPKRTGDQRQTEAHGVPWHHRRGHWAHYSADRPLFGRKGQHGWYWRPYTEVGDKAHGEIVQDYSVKANLPAEAA
jgi:hypothetical protein